MSERAGIIVEFAPRKKWDEFIDAKKKLRNVIIENLRFTIRDNTRGKIFINESLTTKRKSLIRDLKLKKDEYGFEFIWSKKGTVFICRNENSRPIRNNNLRFK